MPKRRYLIVSDFHLADVEDHADGWKAYKHSRFLFDHEFDRAVGSFIAEGDSRDTRTLILNGDMIDFDLVSSVPKDPPWPVSRLERRRGLDATEEKSAWKLKQVLRHHAIFLRTLARFASAGHNIVYIVGNHDPEFNFPEVQSTLVAAVAEQAQQHGLAFAPSCLRFEPWFYCVPGEIYVEHGHQYDYYNSQSYILAPIVATRFGPEIALPMGNLSNRYLMTQMGFFNPLAADFILNAFRYFKHWLKHYALTRRRLVSVWILGSIYVVRKLVRIRRAQAQNPPDYDDLLQELSQRTGLPLETVTALDTLKLGPIGNRIYRVLRELWLDRLILAVIWLAGTLALLFGDLSWWSKFFLPIVGLFVLYTLYGWLTHGDNLFRVQRRIPKFAEAIAKLLSVKLISFGHTHDPLLLPLLPEVYYANSGTWAPVPRGRLDQRLKLGLRNMVVAAFGEGAPPQVRIDTFLSAETAAMLSTPKSEQRNIASKEQGANE